MVENGANRLISCDFDNGLFKNDFNIGFDYNASQSTVFNLEDPDIAGSINPNNPNIARFLLVYTGQDVFNLNNHVFYEIWEFETVGSIHSFIQIIPPTHLSNSGEVFSPNVDVSLNGQIAVGFNLESALHIKAGLDLFDLTQVSNDLDASNTGNGSELFNVPGPNQCNYFINNSWIDVSVTEDGVGCNRFNLTYNYNNGSGVAAAGGEFNLIYAQTILQSSISDCSHILEFDLDLNITGGKRFGPPRIASPSPLAFNQGISCKEYAVTFSEKNNGGEIIVLKANESTVMASDVANLSPYTNMCYNGYPAISFNFESDIITIAWEFYDCNFCIPGNVECPAGGPINAQTKPGYYILSRRYNPTLNRLYNNINVISDPTPNEPDYRYPSVAGRHGLGSGLLFTYDSKNFGDHLTYKVSDLLNPSLVPVSTSIHEINLANENKLVMISGNFFNTVKLKLNKRVAKGTISVFDINGKLIFTRNEVNLKNGMNTFILPTFNSKGVYFINFYAQEFQITEKFIN